MIRGKLDIQMLKNETGHFSSYIKNLDIKTRIVKVQKKNIENELFDNGGVVILFLFLFDKKNTDNHSDGGSYLNTSFCMHRMEQRTWNKTVILK